MCCSLHWVTNDKNGNRLRLCLFKQCFWALNCWPHNSLNRPNHSFQFRQFIFRPQSRVGFIKANIGIFCNSTASRVMDSTFPGPIPISAKPVVLPFSILKPHTCDGCPRTMRHLRVPSAQTSHWIERCKSNDWYETGHRVQRIGDESSHSTQRTTPQLKRWQSGKGMR